MRARYNKAMTALKDSRKAANTRSKPHLAAVTLLAVGVLAGAARAVEYTDIVASKMRVEQSLEEKIQSLLTAVLGPDRSRVSVQAELKLIKAEVEKSAQVSKVKEERSPFTGAGKEEFVLPGIPVKKNPSEMRPLDRPPANAETERAGQSQFELNIPNLVKRLEVTVVLAQSVPDDLIAGLKKTITAVAGINPGRGDKLVVTKMPFLPSTVKPTVQWQGFMKPWVMVAALGTLILAAFLFGPLSGFLKTMGQNVGRSPETSVTIEQGKGEGTGAGKPAGGGALPDLLQSLGEMVPGLEGLPGLGSVKTLEEAKQKLQEAKARAEKSQGRPFGFVNTDNIQSLIYLLYNENPDLTALVLSYLNPGEVAEVIQALPEEQQAKVGIAFASVRQATEEQVRAVEDDLRRKVDFLVGGVDRFLAVFDNLPKSVRETLLKALEEYSPPIAARVRESILSFESLGALPNAMLERVIRELKTDELAVALRGVAPESKVMARVLENMSEGAKAMLREEMEFGRAVTETQIDEAQRKIIALLKELEAKGQVALTKHGRIGLLGPVEPLALSGPFQQLPAAGGAVSAAGGDPYAEGEALYNEGRYEPAAEAFSRTVELDPANGPAWQYLGACRAAAGDTAGAVAAYERALELNPDDASLKEYVDGLRQQAPVQS